MVAMTQLDDKLHQTEYSRHYYSHQKSFEQSLDVYKPIMDDSGENAAVELPLVVLVVGSAWLGHRSFVYTGTSWWNSPAPQTFAKLGCVCVYVRHRGAFPVCPALSLVLPLFVGVAAITIAVSSYRRATEVTGVLVLLWSAWALAGRGSAGIDDMLHDVVDALAWVRDNRKDHLVLKSHKERDDRPFVFGGYSSGGHVAATLLQRPELFEARGLPPPERHVDAALFLSGVLAVRPPVPPKETDRCLKNSPSSSTENPRWFTDIVTRMAFGNSGASSLPSPLHGDTKPRVPHLLIGCKEEAFGIDWMDLYFCSRDFARSLEVDGVPARYVEVQSNHWFVLGSRALTHALRQELVWITNKGQDRKNSVCPVCNERYCTRACTPRPEDLRRD